MKKVMFVLLSIAIFASLAVAQVTYNGLVGGNPIGATTPIDKLGAHNNGGRGCTGCHAPHSGARGNGGNAAAGGAVTDTETGVSTLWGQDMGPLAGQTFAWGDEGAYTQTFPAVGSFYTGDNEKIATGIMMCLSCHDGNIAKGAMMTNASWEQRMNLLPDTYGAGTIPTLLADDQGPNNYENDHPVGVNATLGALGVGTRFVIQNGKFTTTDAAMLEFKGNYGLPQFLGRSTPVIPSGTANGSNANTAYVVCTTCHTPHSMYTTSASSSNPFGGVTSGTFATFFFINAPYNPTHVPTASQASSTAQFCRQCHFTGAGGSNEGAGIHGVTTAF